MQCVRYAFYIYIQACFWTQVSKRINHIWPPPPFFFQRGKKLTKMFVSASEFEECCNFMLKHLAVLIMFVWTGWYSALFQSLCGKKKKIVLFGLHRFWKLIWQAILMLRYMLLPVDTASQYRRPIYAFKTRNINHHLFRPLT